MRLDSVCAPPHDAWRGRDVDELLELPHVIMRAVINDCSLYLSRDPGLRSCRHKLSRQFGNCSTRRRNYHDVSSRALAHAAHRRSTSLTDRASSVHPSWLHRAEELTQTLSAAAAGLYRYNQLGSGCNALAAGLRSPYCSTGPRHSFLGFLNVDSLVISRP
ncbi:hypothetical protein K466DRAFT_60495 [Polyporus arcularius HHB13444]|uniref:Uncharacterized protein n=1 Tax=Polyporus arcularius HHB13444 TaxID=1314778 RepID=A0A5C3Q5Z1_9APHY|nr:hypothetical protein K466DRAFT_60495 [Polyporus arcularius HHB13444]